MPDNGSACAGTVYVVYSLPSSVSTRNKKQGAVCERSLCAAHPWTRSAAARTCQHPQPAEDGCSLPMCSLAAQLCVQDLGSRGLGHGQLGGLGDQTTRAAHTHEAVDVVAPGPQVTSNWVSGRKSMTKVRAMQRAFPVIGQ